RKHVGRRSDRLGAFLRRACRVRSTPDECAREQRAGRFHSVSVRSIASSTHPIDVPPRFTSARRVSCFLPREGTIAASPSTVRSYVVSTCQNERGRGFQSCTSITSDASLAISVGGAASQ